nr:tetratricopeptide repeat protein [Tepidiforma sp.]
MKHRIFLDELPPEAARRRGPRGRSPRATPAIPRARYRWGVMLAAQEKYEQALDELLESVRLDRTFADGAARKAMLAIFDILGLDSPVTREYQRRLSNILF